MRQTLIIARREFLSYAGTWGFWLSVLSFPLIGAVAGLVVTLSASSTPTRHIAVITDDAALQRVAEAAFADLRDDDVVLTPAPARMLEGLRPYLLGERIVTTADGPQSLDAAVFLRREADGGVTLDYWSLKLTDQGPRRHIARAVAGLMREEALAAAGIDGATVARINELAPRVRELTPKRAGAAAQVGARDRAPFIIGGVMSIVLWLVVFSVANMLLTSTIEERATKVFDSLLTAATPLQILTGKLLGVAAVSAALVVVWGVFASTGLSAMASLYGAAAQPWLAALADPALLAPMLFFFVVGYLMFGALYLAVGSLCDTIQEAQTLMTPMMIFTMPPILVTFIMFDNPDSPVLRVMSWVPTYAPFLGPMRLPTEPPVLEIAALCAGMLATTFALLWGAARVFRLGLVGGLSPQALRAALMRAVGLSRSRPGSDA